MGGNKMRISWRPPLMLLLIPLFFLYVQCTWGYKVGLCSLIIYNNKYNIIVIW